MLDICGGQAGPIDDQVLALPECKPVALRSARAAKVIGMPVTQAQCASVFSRLALPFTEAPGVLTVTPPSWRFDLAVEEDLIEEVIRVVGFNTLPHTPPIAPVTARMPLERTRSPHRVRHALAALDYFETINFSFVEARWEHELAGNADPIRVLNPLASPLSVMRSSLMGSLVNTLRYNLARKAARVRLFEVGRVFMRNIAVTDGPLSVAGINQPMHVAGLAYGSADSLQWSAKDRSVDFFDVKGDVEALLSPLKVSFVAAVHPALHPGRSARIDVNGVAVGHVGELHPKWRQSYELPLAPVLFELDLAAVLQRPVPALTAIPKQQSVSRDIAVIVNEAVTHNSLMAAFHAAPTPLVRSALLFDIYKPQTPTVDIGAGERSMAVRLELLDDNETLTDERIEAVVAQVLDSLATRLGARLRR